MATRTLAQLTDEFQERGYHYLPLLRQQLFINNALAELAESFSWPFLENVITSAPPVNMGSLAGANYSRSVMSVNISATEVSLPFVERVVLTKQGLNLDQTGTPECWYWQGAYLKVWPVSTANIDIEFTGAAQALVNPTDALSAPTMFFSLIIDGAVIKGLQNTDNYAEAQAALQVYDRQLQALIGAYATRQTAPKFILEVRGSDG